MARKKTTVKIETEGRDKGKVFLLTEMPARQAEKWGARALLLAAQSGANVANVNAGMLGVVTMGLQAVLGGVRFSDVEPLLDEMLACVAIVPDPRHPEVTRPIIDDDLEEWATITRLRQEVLELHLGFSLADALSNLRSSAAPTSQEGSPNTSMSPTRSAP